MKSFNYRGLLLPVALISVWWAGSSLNWINPNFLPHPSKVLAVASEQWQQGELTESIKGSLLRNLSGFAVGILSGLLFGALLGISTVADKFLTPSFNFMKQIALLAWIPLLSMWFGQGETAKVVLIALAAFYPMVINTHLGIRTITHEHREVAKVLTLTRWQTFRKLILPSAAPQIFTGLQLALIYSWLATIAAEYFFKAGPGIANPLIDGRETFNMALVIYGMLIIAVLGAFFNSIAASIEKHTLRWRKAHR